MTSAGAAFVAGADAPALDTHRSSTDIGHPSIWPQPHPEASVNLERASTWTPTHHLEDGIGMKGVGVQKIAKREIQKSIGAYASGGVGVQMKK